MSRHVTAKAWGIVTVETKCDVCQNGHKLNLSLDGHPADIDLEWEAMQSHDWYFLDDLRFCSEACYDRYSRMEER